MPRMEPFVPDPDVGQPGWVLLDDGRRAFRYAGSDELIYEKPSAPTE